MTQDTEKSNSSAILSPHEKALLVLFTQYEDAQAYGKKDNLFSFFLLLFANLVTIIGCITFFYLSFYLWKENKSNAQLFISLAIAFFFALISLTPYIALGLHKQIKRWYIKGKLNVLFASWCRVVIDETRKGILEGKLSPSFIHEHMKMFRIAMTAHGKFTLTQMMCDGLMKSLEEKEYQLV